jgi:ABC-2 type transport system ATP-binding protein
MSELEISDAADEYVTNYSLGMKKKMALSLALIHDPAVLILDEPTTGLDPLGARRIQDLIRSYALRGRTVLLSTHQLEMAERLCDTVGILHGGRLVAEGPSADLRAQMTAVSSGRDQTLEEVFLALTSDRDPAAMP